MSELVTLSKRGSIGVITVNNPPVNALSPGVPEGLVDCVSAANADSSIEAMVLIGAGRGFIAGADIKFLGKPRSEKAGLMKSTLEDSAKPLVAAIHGHALGGGLEASMLCHYRIAVASAKVGLPEVLIGVLPGGGGTQRLPRLIGPQAALEMILSGRHVPADEALRLGILDEVVSEGELLDAAVAFAERVASDPVRRIRDLDDKLKAYLVDVVLATRDPSLCGASELAAFIRFGASPRATISLALASKAVAFMQGRSFVTPQDIKDVGLDVLRHRVIISYEAEAENVTSDDIIRKIFETVPVP